MDDDIQYHIFSVT